ncbi:hypothetical protein SAMN05216223_103126 [Actinacidiphila yanglinensis]|uniref:Uncharacterized protein n=1 Tax=Actinacidiphila yanglinensis TaxID=310779 RepID=A0A1H5X708_9ACTN|nr:DUF6099 family protein [Actinacidiphila yanglinensis]SEG07531.1 hypothetical protein SAMN05216223_103126 [Actinacidiphila yanglinensis]
MDAVRLVEEASRAMGRDPQPDDVIAEAWQAYELTDAIGRLLAEEWGRRAEGEGGRPGRCGSTRDPGGTVSRAGPVPVVSATRVGPPRAARLTTVRDPTRALRALRTLLGEIGLALVALITSACDEEAYWECVEALDAVDEAKDRVQVLARAESG